MVRNVPMSFGVTALYLFLLSGAAYAAHPLITDDTGVQGKGRVQIEVNGAYGTDKETVAGGVAEKVTATAAAVTLSYGATDALDLVLGVPYVAAKVTDDGTTVYDESGMSDVSFDAKWRFFEKDGLSFALKPGLSLPTGDEQKGLGAGKTGYRLFLIGTVQSEPWAFHGNIGFIRNEFDPQGGAVDEEKNLWHASLATEYTAAKGLRVVGNVGIEKNPEKGATDDLAFALLGAVYALSEGVDIDGGIKVGLTDPETDTTLLAGVTFRF